jgi:hypothetical protein
MEMNQPLMIGCDMKILDYILGSPNNLSCCRLEKFAVYNYSSFRIFVPMPAATLVPVGKE